MNLSPNFLAYFSLTLFLFASKIIAAKEKA